MEKPKDYDEITAYGEYEKLEKGGHICRIIRAEEYVSQSGYEMIKIYMDTDKTDRQPEFFKNKYENDTREKKFWGCILYIMRYETDGKTSGRFKGLVESVEKSNNCEAEWGANFFDWFKDKLIGGVFRYEEYLNQNNEKKIATKCCRVTTVEKIKKGVAIPKDKLVETKPVEIYDDDLPF